jgi:hypothetical protein
MALDDLHVPFTPAVFVGAAAGGAAGKKIKVARKKSSKRRTEIRVPVGMFGDESLSLQILDEIKKQF